MRFDLKKIFFIIIFLVIIGLLAWLLWRLFFSSPLPARPDGPSNVGLEGGQLPQAEDDPGGRIVDDGEEFFIPDPGDVDPVVTPPDDDEVIERDNKISELVPYPSFSPTLSDDGSNVQYYDRAKDVFYRINQNGEAEALSDQKFYDVDTVSWSPGGDKAIMEFPDGTTLLYNFETDTQVNLPEHYTEFNFTPVGDQVLFKSYGSDTSDSYLAIMNSDGTGSRALERIGNNAPKVTVTPSPNNQIAATFTESAGSNSQDIYFIGYNGENFKSLPVEGMGFESTWSTSGDRLIYSVYQNSNGYRPSLWIADASGDNIGEGKQPLYLETWASKCVFINNAQAYCAVPEYLPENSGLFPHLADEINDDLYLVDLDKGSSTLVDSSLDYRMNNLVLAKTGNHLFFTDRFGALHKYIF